MGLRSFRDAGVLQFQFWFKWVSGGCSVLWGSGGLGGFKVEGVYDMRSSGQQSG